ncbi:hypothetical protein F1880_008553 [Penicillium rolfsii]|nr:hypothetical protein F1880_008553 [Penicillium rolfsii]
MFRTVSQTMSPDRSEFSWYVRRRYGLAGSPSPSPNIHVIVAILRGLHGLKTGPELQGNLVAARYGRTRRSLSGQE